jgi:7-cyano-7-deazaguanine synthase
MSGKTALLFSGGLDSFCAHKWLQELDVEHDLVYIPCGTDTSKFERATIETMSNVNMITEPIIIQSNINLKDLQAPDGFVPLRNLLFLALPVMEGYERVYIAAVKGEGSLDKSHKFFKDTSELFSYMLSKKVGVSSPVDQFTKTQLVSVVLKTIPDVTQHNLTFTTSCYNPFVPGFPHRRCGECNACVRRWVAMVNNNIYESYAIDPVYKAIELLEETKLTKILEQPLGRWPDVILTNKEMRDAVNKIGR